MLAVGTDRTAGTRTATGNGKGERETESEDREAGNGEPRIKNEDWRWVIIVGQFQHFVVDRPVVGRSVGWGQGWSVGCSVAHRQGPATR
ncbi:unnamed protein product [Angiostrongylus costaricensis]|uniref:Uncharacterized protein n=1 Tax=Angiostrongylus costaricensis TaxID=334426 RepID=A0A0R3PQP6_ANGCS|nr:unnamed protein product [Angiostrongylus costaricensis]